jgi:large-conductance mechanosensitive channel
MDNSSETEYFNPSLGKHLKAIAEQQAIIAEQQKRQTEYLRNISAVLTLLLIAIVLFLLIFAATTGII